MASPMIIISAADDTLKRFGNQLGALGEGDAHKALARAVNRVTTTVHGRVIKAVAKQSSIPRYIVKGAVKRRLTSVKPGQGAIEGVVWATGKPISLKYFHPRQVSYGVTAKVQGGSVQYPHAFMGPRPGVLASALRGNVFIRTSSRRFPIKMLYGPSVPEELVRGETVKIFEETVATMLPARVQHEIGRLLPK
jgi:hypothetical protein